jgi:hypothetical protein
MLGNCSLCLAEFFRNKLLCTHAPDPELVAGQAPHYDAEAVHVSQDVLAVNSCSATLLR